MKAREFCTCTNTKCPIHPTKHNQGCTPCIQKNLRMKEIPTCFQLLVDPENKREGDTFQDFAKAVLKKQ